ncbi:MAG: tRNA (N6-isopentenyl adenosine(37)-C2)-methylthiotransferase MiaB [Omnitrophica bacterium]|nr:tRNA (N6-isopentenyl adenosine(37)-C2)-methylthiotransferase MiaB [Candidatus Omnitrophota bacterium]
MKKSVYIRTFGCQMNNRDSEFIGGVFIDKGYKLVDLPGEAGVILFNTCSVRAHAEERAISSMGQLMHEHKNRIYGIVGCAAQALGEGLFKRLPGLNIVCGTGEITRLPELVKEAENGRVLALEDKDALLPELKPTYRQDKDAAYVSIMRGCDNFCAYCIVPYVRGRERSRSADGIISEIRDLAGQGIRDVTLLGQNVNSYRPKAEGRRSKAYGFVELLCDVNKIDGIEKINFMTSHPKDATGALFKAMKNLDKVRKHLHLPLQSGSDRILKLMQRGYTRGGYFDLISEALAVIPGLRVTTDIIVGFPGEGEEDFGKTRSLMEEMKFDSAYIFKYSPRAGTEAAKMPDDVSLRLKKERHKTLLDLQRSISKGKAHEKTDCCHCT